VHPEKTFFEMAMTNENSTIQHEFMTDRRGKEDAGLKMSQVNLKPGHSPF
jgi:hypothetical protein